ERDLGRAREGHEALEHPLLLALEMALDLHVAVRPAEDRNEPLQDTPGAFHVAGADPPRERPARAAGATHAARGGGRESVARPRENARGEPGWSARMLCVRRSPAPGPCPTPSPRRNLSLATRHSPDQSPAPR